MNFRGVSEEGAMENICTEIKEGIKSILEKIATQLTSWNIIGLNRD
jgi:hypothetical protein